MGPHLLPRVKEGRSGQQKFRLSIEDLFLLFTLVIFLELGFQKFEGVFLTLLSSFQFS